MTVADELGPRIVAATWGSVKTGRIGETAKSSSCLWERLSGSGPEKRETKLFTDNYHQI
jgi:hypothetical protein